MELGTLKQFCDPLEGATDEQVFYAACKRVRGLLESFSRSREDIAAIAQAVRRGATQFPADVTVEVTLPPSPDDGKSKAKPAKPVVEQVNLRKYAEDTAVWVEKLSPDLATVPPRPAPATPTAPTAEGSAQATTTPSPSTPAT